MQSRTALGRTWRTIMDNQTPLRVGIVGCGYQGGILAQTVIR